MAKHVSATGGAIDFVKLERGSYGLSFEFWTDRWYRPATPCAAGDPSLSYTPVCADSLLPFTSFRWSMPISLRTAGHASPVTGPAGYPRQRVTAVESSRSWAGTPAIARAPPSPTAASAGAATEWLTDGAHGQSGCER